MGLVGEEPENPWLHDNRRRADKGEEQAFFMLIVTTFTVCMESLK